MSIIKSVLKFLLLFFFIAQFSTSPLPAEQPGVRVDAKPNDVRVNNKTGALPFKEIMWAKTGNDGRMVTVSEPRFRRGETIYLVFRQVGPFKAGEDGKHHLDIDMRVTGPSGAVVLDKKGLLGAAGVRQLKGGIASSPYGIFESSVVNDAGEHQMTITIHDKISGAKASATKPLHLLDGLGYKKTLFARKDKSGGIQPVKSGIFQRGEAVHLVVLNAGKFKKGDDGLHRFEINMSVKGPQGTVVYQKQNMLGEGGHLLLKNDVAATPYGLLYTTVEFDAGTHVMTLILRDIIANQEISITRPFTLK